MCEVSKLPIPVVIDCDSGNDDAWAIISLLKAEQKFNLKLLGITCCNGNTTVDHSSLNNLLILETVNRMDVPVYAGAESSLIKKTEYYKPFHGADGFGEIYKTKPDKELIQKKHAVEALKDFIEEYPRDIVLIAVAPLTNIALLYKLYPGISDKIREIHIMGGNYKGVGNVTRSAEFNFWMDPEAANIVLAESMCPVYIFPWEACLEAGFGMHFEDWRINVLAENKNSLTNLLDPIEKKAYLNVLEWWTPCDAFSVACFMLPQLITKMTHSHVTVELTGAHTRGQMIIDHTKKDQPNAHVIETIDVELFKKLMLWVCDHKDSDNFL